MGSGGIPVENLTPGMVLSESVYSEDGRQLLIKQGVTLSEDIIRGLLKRGITTVTIGENTQAAPAGPRTEAQQRSSCRSPKASSGRNGFARRRRLCL